MVYLDNLTQVELLTDEEAGKLFKSLFKFSIDSEDYSNNLEPMTKMAYSFMTEQIRRDNQRYEERCKTNAQNAKKGGIAKKRLQAIASEGVSSQAKVPDIDKDIETDIDIVIEKEIEKDTDTEKSVADSVATDNESADADYLTLGSQNNVFLSLREYTTLKQKYGEIADKKIQWLSEYMPTRDKNYKNHFILLDNWCMEEVLANKEKKEKQEREKKRKQENKPAYDLDEFMRTALMSTPKHTSVGDGVLDIPKSE